MFEVEAFLTHLNVDLKSADIEILLKVTTTKVAQQNFLCFCSQLAILTFQDGKLCTTPETNASHRGSVKMQNKFIHLENFILFDFELETSRKLVGVRKWYGKMAQ